MTTGGFSGPTPRGARPTWKQRFGSWKATAFALLIAGFALLIALIAVAAAGLALSRQGDSTIAVSNSTPGTAVSQAPAPSASVSASTPEGGLVDSTPTDIVPSGAYSVAYEGKTIRVQPPCSGNSSYRYVDLDEPRVGVESEKSEFYFGSAYSCTGQPRMEIDRVVALAPAPSASASPEDCAEAIRSGPISPPVVATSKLSVCLRTSRAQADQEGITQKMILVTVTSIAKDGTTAFTLSAWDIPS